MTNAQYNERASYLSGLKDEYETCCNEQIQLDVRLGKLANLDSIEEIALRCGYSDLKFFRSLFRSRLRMTPSEFRGKSRR